MFSKESNGKGIASKTYALSSPTSRLNNEVLNDSASIRRSAAGGDVQIHGGSEDEGWYSTIMRSSNSLWVILGISLAGGIAASAIIFFRSRRHRQTSKDFGAFVKYLELLPPPQPAPPIAPHPLTGLTFAIKDNFDVESFITGFGLPDWEKTHEPASFTAHAVETLVQAGATCIGKTQMDIMGCSLSGQNTHYEPLINPATTVHIPGGSSGGSAVAVSAGLVDFALGTDTNGDVRLPAALCEVLGIRSSHGFIPCTGVVPVAKSLDTVGWFAKDSKVLYKVGQVLLRSQVSEVNRPKRVLVADDCFRFLSVSENRCLSVAINAIEKAYGSMQSIHFYVCGLAVIFVKIFERAFLHQGKQYLI